MDGRAGIDAALVHRLITAQFPQWRDLPVTPVAADGWDNRTYRLGETKTVRLPTHEMYAAAIDKEHRWLPVLAASLPVPIPEPLAKGRPGEGYPFEWSIRRWMNGETASPDRIADMPALATSIAEFLLALQRIDPSGGPHAGEHSFYRGAPPSHYDHEVRRSLDALRGRMDTARATAVWDAAISAEWNGPPVWFHGDVAAGNLLVRDGTLAGVIDFGTCGVGDPACDLVIAWTFFSGRSRETFRQRVDQDKATWARARGWALWKALISLAGIDANQQAVAANQRIIDDVLAEHDG